MEKKLTYEEYVRIQNLLTKIKSHVDVMEDAKDEIHSTISEIKSILDLKDVEQKD
jgi:hypothetical protein